MGFRSTFIIFISDFILDNKDRDTLSPWKPWLIDGLTFPHHALRIFYSNLGIVMDTESLEEMYKSLSILQAGKQSQEEIHQVPKEVKEKLFYWSDIVHVSLFFAMIFYSFILCPQKMQILNVFMYFDFF